MRKYILLFLILILIMSCAKQNNISKETTCPMVTIAKEHQNYFSADQKSSNEMNYLATINNFETKCKLINQKEISSILDILFVIKPLKNNVKIFEYTYFISILDNNNRVLDYQLFKVKDKFHLGENLQPMETTIIESLNQHFPTQDTTYQTMIGFVLTEEKYNLINN